MDRNMPGFAIQLDFQYEVAQQTTNLSLVEAFLHRKCRLLSLAKNHSVVAMIPLASTSTVLTNFGSRYFDQFTILSL